MLNVQYTPFGDAEVSGILGLSDKEYQHAVACGALTRSLHHEYRESCATSAHSLVDVTCFLALRYAGWPGIDPASVQAEIDCCLDAACILTEDGGHILACRHPTVLADLIYDLASCMPEYDALGVGAISMAPRWTATAWIHSSCALGAVLIEEKLFLRMTRPTHMHGIIPDRTVSAFDSTDFQSYSCRSPDAFCDTREAGMVHAPGGPFALPSALIPLPLVIM